MSLLVDTGVLLAAADKSDPDHERCVALLSDYPGQLLTTDPVVTETGWSIAAQLGGEAEARFYGSVADGELACEQLNVEDRRRIAELTEKYADFPLGGVDASLIAVAERLGLSTVATLDHRHFRAVRPKHVSAFNLVP